MKSLLATEKMIIYKITNAKNNKVYIGQTTRTFNQRYNSKGVGVERVLNTDKANTHLANSIKKYGVDSFDVSIIDWGDSVEDLNRKEQLWIQHYQSNNEKYGYNKQAGGDNHTVMKQCYTTLDELEAGLEKLSQIYDRGISLSDVCDLLTVDILDNKNKNELYTILMRSGIKLLKQSGKFKNKDLDKPLPCAVWTEFLNNLIANYQLEGVARNE